ncbi:MAG: sulfatase-like hydrolase/transferase, partial [Verrucomicrobiae bacterium]|nr:sulfatase-like hydrolase/transferase [Verrucomicrobiae bacterium]
MLPGHFLPMKKVFLHLTCLLLVSVSACLAASRPNVLLILTDDQGYGDLSLHNNPHLKTPTMDRIGKEGVRLDRFYVSPVCAPTRASLLTGRYHPRTGVSGVTRRLEVLDPAEVTFADLLSAQGYATGCFGKWHNGSVYPETPNGQGFDEFLGFLGGVTSRYFDPELNHNGLPETPAGFITEILTEAAMDWMGEQIERDQPFFCYLPYNTPHTPALVPEAYWRPFEERGVGRWEAAIYGMVRVLDEQIGRLLAFLEEQGVADDTLVIFMSDNGPVTWRYNAGLRGKKGSVYEGGIRVPCFIRWPGKLTPGLIEEPLMHVDLLPTL